MLQTRWCPSLLCLLLVHPLLLFTSASVPSNPPPIPNCSPSSCGNSSLQISYPFWLPQNSLSVYCGYPDLMLDCHNNNTILSLPNAGNYTITAFNISSQTLTLIDTDAIADANCPHPRYNLSIYSKFYDSTLTFTSEDTELFFYYNCSQTSVTGDVPLRCGDGGRSSYVLTQDMVSPGADCAENVVVPVMHEAVMWSKSFLSGDVVGVMRKGFQLHWNWHWSGGHECLMCEVSGGLCGHGLMGFVCLCQSGINKEYCHHEWKAKAGNKLVTRKVIIGLSFLLICVVLFFCIPLYCYIIHSNRLNTIAQTIENFLVSYEYLGTKRYKYSAVKKITKSFSEKLGQGGYGAVFKGKFPDGRSVAVKLLSGTKGNGDEFVNEVASIGRTSHVNVVSLLGFCSEGSKRALIYEFMPNGSLDKYIYSDNLKSTLGWDKLYQIAFGIAHGLEYLHRGCNTRIVHFDIKPHNILLDQDFCPKIADFGLAQLCMKKDSMFSAIDMRGTIGYIAPELFLRNFGVVSSKSDVYSYGMMILEMVGVRNNRSQSCNESDSGYYFPHWIYENFHQIGRMEGLDVTADTVEIAKKMILVGLWCIQTKPGSRPTMSKVVDMLQSNIDQLELPPKPYLASP